MIRCSSQHYYSASAKLKTYIGVQVCGVSSAPTPFRKDAAQAAGTNPLLGEEPPSLSSAIHDDQLGYSVLLSSIMAVL